MANIRKSFNFKNGVQVDNDKFIVNPNGLVGIGTTIPRELLDVRGTTKVTGILTATDLHGSQCLVSGVGTISNFTDGVLQISSGIITAVTGVVTFYGDGAGLINIPSSQWVDIDVGLGYTSIYAQGNVGVGTNDPRFSFQVGGQAGTPGHEGVGINSRTGDILSTGIITATTFSGNLSGVEFTVNNGTVTEGLTSGNIVVSGVGTINNLLEMRSNDATPARIDFYCESTNAHRTRVQSAPHSEYTGNVDTVLPTVSGDIIVGDTASAITQDINTTGDITAAGLTGSSLDVSGIGTVTTFTATTSASVGTGTAFTALDTGKIGIGTADPQADLQIRKPSGASIDLVAESGTARFNIGNNDTTGQTSAEIRYGAQADTLDIVNKSTGNIRFVIDENPVGLNTGAFTWHHQSPATTLMTLTYDGMLGINNASPSEKVSVGGGITATGNSFFDGNVTANSFTGNGANLTNITVPDPVTVNTFRQTGISTFGEIHVFNNTGVGNPLTVGLSSIGISTQSAIAGLDARRDIGLFSRLAINSDSINGIQMPRQAFEIVFGDIRLEVDGSIKTSAIGIGASARSALDMNGAVGLGLSYAPLILSSVTNAQRNTIVDRVSGGSTVTGSIIYNSNANEFQGYDGTSWSSLGGGGGADTNTTYTLPASASGNDVNLTLTGSDASTDAVLFTAGDNINFSSVSAGGFTINAEIPTGGVWETTDVGINTVSNVGIGTTNPETPLQVGDIYGVQTGIGTFDAMTNVLENIDSFTIATNDFLTAEYTLHLTNSAGTQVSKALVMQNGTTSDSQEFAIMFSDSLLVSVGSSVFGGDCHLNVTPQTGISGLTTYRFTRQTML